MGRQLVLVATFSLLLLVIDVARGKPSDDLELESDVAEDVDTEAEMWSIVNRMADLVNERQAETVRLVNERAAASPCRGAWKAVFDCLLANKSNCVVQLQAFTDCRATNWTPA